MDLRTVMTISTLLLMSTESAQAHGNETSGQPTSSNSTERDCFCHSAAPTAAVPSFTPSSYAPAVAVLIIEWTSDCKGDVILYHSPSFTSPVCHGSKANVSSLLRNVCQNKKGCKGTPRWDKGGDTQNGYDIKESGAVKTESCKTLKLRCTVEVLPDVQGQLQAYKVVTGLLCCVLLLLLLIRFTTPTVKALQKRLSDRRQNRWIGPTQSHSVSYHRGKTAVKNNDGEKRLSYPALERLTVSDSREPSSNRNSDYNL